MSEHTPPPRRISPKRAALLIGGACLIAILLVGATLAASARARVYTMQTALKVMGANIATDEKGQTNILLLGVGDARHDGANLTDTMMIASIDPLKTRSVVLLSLPRDLWLDANTRLSQGRINTIYTNEKYRLQVQEGFTKEGASQQALKSVAAEIGERLGLEIHGVLKADFAAFEEIVDSVGGVDIDVKEQLVDYAYPVAENKVGTFELDAGLQHLDGKTALMYARSRHSTNDFDRSARQQQLLAALADKIRSMGRLAQIQLLADLNERIEDHVEITMTRNELLGLAQIAADLSLDRMMSIQINFTSGSDYAEAAAGGFVFPADPALFEGASVLLPTASPNGSNDWGQIRTFAQMLTANRSLYLADANILLENPGARLVDAHRLRNELLRYGWDVLPIKAPDEKLKNPPETSSIFYRTNDDADTAKFMGQLLSLPVTQGEETGSGDVRIVLGSSYKFQGFRTLSGAVLTK